MPTHLPPSPRQVSKAAGAFTLVEMLSVLTVAGILLSFGVPGFFSAHLSRTLSSSTAAVSGALDEARWTAIQKRTYTRVLFPSAPIPDLEARLGRSLALASYGIAVWDRQTSTWALDEPWRALPDGLGFEDDDSPDFLPISSPSGAGLISGGSRTVDDIDLDRDGDPDPFTASIITFFADGSCDTLDASGQRVTSWVVTIGEGEIGPDGSFTRRGAKAFRSLSLTCNSGALTEIVPAP